MTPGESCRPRRRLRARVEEDVAAGAVSGRARRSACAVPADEAEDWKRNGSPSRLDLTRRTSSASSSGRTARDEAREIEHRMPRARAWPVAAGAPKRRTTRRLASTTRVAPAVLRAGWRAGVRTRGAAGARRASTDLRRHGEPARATRIAQKSERVPTRTGHVGRAQRLDQTGSSACEDRLELARERRTSARRTSSVACRRGCASRSSRSSAEQLRQKAA